MAWCLLDLQHFGLVHCPTEHLWVLDQLEVQMSINLNPKSMPLPTSAK